MDSSFKLFCRLVSATFVICNACFCFSSSSILSCMTARRTVPAIPGPGTRAPTAPRTPGATLLGRLVLPRLGAPRQPRGFKSQLAQDLDAKYKEEGLDPAYCIYAVALAVNDIAPEQVLIDHDIKGPDKFEHADAGRHPHPARQRPARASCRGLSAWRRKRGAAVGHVRTGGSQRADEVCGRRVGRKSQEAFRTEGGAPPVGSGVEPISQCR